MSVAVQLAGTVQVEGTDLTRAKERIEDWLEYHTLQNDVVVTPIDPDHPPTTTQVFAVFEPCSQCGTVAYDDHTLALYAMGQVKLDMNPTHLCQSNSG